MSDRLGTHSLTTLVGVTWGTSPLEGLESIDGVRVEAQWLVEDDNVGNTVRSYVANKRVNVQIVVPKDSADSVFTFQQAIEAVDEAPEAIAAFTLPFAATDASDGSSITADKAFLLGHPTEGWSKARSGLQVLTYTMVLTGARIVLRGRQQS